MTGSTTGEQGAFRYLQRRLNDPETLERSRECVKPRLTGSPLSNGRLWPVASTREAVAALWWCRLLRGVLTEVFASASCSARRQPDSTPTVLRAPSVRVGEPHWTFARKPAAGETLDESGRLHSLRARHAVCRVGP